MRSPIIHLFNDRDVHDACATYIIDADNLRDAWTRSCHLRHKRRNGDVILLRMHVEQNSTPCIPSSIPVLSIPRMIASLLYDMWLLEIADGAVISGATKELRQQTGSLLAERGCILNSAVPQPNTDPGTDSAHRSDSR